MTFQKAVKHQSPLTLVISGPSGAGKTFTGLTMGTDLARRAGGRLAVIDTERGSSAKYADLFDFDSMTVRPPYAPERFTRAVLEAAAAGFKVLLIDSLTHAWKEAGGALDMVDAISGGGGNSFTAWATVTPVYREMIDTIVGTDMHVIVTLRSKTAYAVEDRQNKAGRMVATPVRLGMQPVIREGTEYEFDIVMDMDRTNTASITKTRCFLLNGAIIAKPGAALVETVWEWLQGEPVVSVSELKENASAVSTYDEWAELSYIIPDVAKAFESPQRLVDWRTYVTKEVEASSQKCNRLLQQILDVYCESVTNGVKVSIAVGAAKAHWEQEAEDRRQGAEALARHAEAQVEADHAKSQAKAEAAADATRPELTSERINRVLGKPPGQVAQEAKEAALAAKAKADASAALAAAADLPPLESDKSYSIAELRGKQNRRRQFPVPAKAGSTLAAKPYGTYD